MKPPSLSIKLKQGETDEAINNYHSHSHSDRLALALVRRYQSSQDQIIVAHADQIA